MRKYLGIIVIAVLVLLLISAGAIVGLYTDWLWFNNIGFGVVFSKMVVNQIGMGLVMGLLFFGIVYGNLWYARRIAPPPSPMGLEHQLIERLGSLARRGIGIVIFLASIIVSIMMALEAATHWQNWLMYTSASSFGVIDPVFGKDIGFYVFKMPFISYAYGWLFFALAVATITSAAIHYADEAIEVFGNRIQFAPKVKAHLGVLIALMFFLKAYGYRLAMYGLLNSQGAQFDGAGYTDIHARIPAMWILIVVTIIGGLLVLMNIARRGVGLAIAGFVGVIGASILVGGIYPAMVEQFSVQPNQKDKEAPYISRAIEATQIAYGLGDVHTKLFAANDTLTADQAVANKATIENIRLWDSDHLQQAYNQIQTLQQYYHFGDVDVDRYWLTDPKTGEKQYRQVWLSARELDQSRLAEGSQTWVNLHLQYTHGYGYVMSPVNEMDSEGKPNFFVKDISPRTAVGLPMDQMSAYFGELTNNYVFVKTSAQEFNFPGDGGKTTKYKATSGIQVGGFLRKLVMAIKYSDINILLNENIQSDSRILYDRDIETRMTKALPFLRFDSDPYLVTANGKLYWIRDAYTITDAYPYSKRQLMPDGTYVNYIRNSVKVVVDAYTGAVDAYIVEKPLNDPIIETYRKMYPGILKPVSQMPKELKEHLRYPEDLFQIQTALYARWHYDKDNPNGFYNNADLWKIPGKAELGTSSDQAATVMEPYYVIMKLPGEDSEEFMLMTPYVRAGERANMVSWICAKCDPKDYGRIELYQFPNQKNVYGPQQIVARVNQDPVISSRLSLWGQKGSTVGTGNLLVVPIESSLLYVMPVYLISEGNQIPEIKKVIVALGDNIAMESTLDQALSKVIGAQVSVTTLIGAPAAPVKPGAKPVPSADISGLIDQASQQYDKSQAAQRNGDWAEYGKQVNALKATLEELKKKAK
ncbi:MAG: UPF0182 family protein [Armatimonadetes bacterium]|nr:UPF0182 family protein [Armatimonadota bacterium]